MSIVYQAHMLVKQIELHHWRTLKDLMEDDPWNTMAMMIVEDLQRQHDDLWFKSKPISGQDLRSLMWLMDDLFGNRK